MPVRTEKMRFWENAVFDAVAKTWIQGWNFRHVHPLVKD